MTPILPERLDWSSAIGYFLLNFGVLHWHLLVFLENHAPAEKFAKIKDEHFHDHIKLIKQLVSSGSDSVETRLAFERFLDRANKVRELRNHLAHGHLLIRRIEEAKTFQVVLTLPKDLNSAEVPATRTLEFAELANALAELTAVIKDFKSLSGGWPAEEIKIPSQRH